MTKTNTQNRPYDDKPMMVKAIFEWEDSGHFNVTLGSGDFKLSPKRREELVFDWNDRTQVRKFASLSDRVIRSGGSTLLSKV